MLEPDRFGMTDAETLGRVPEPRSSRHHGSFWHLWADAVWARAVELRSRRDADESDPTATHEFEGIRSVRIGCALLLPKERPVRAGVVSLHGAGVPRPLGDEATRWRSLLARGVAVLSVRVRGFPGSLMDVPRSVRDEGGGDPERWALHGLDAGADNAAGAMDWIVPQAVADAVDACRALRVWLDAHDASDAPLFLRGESLGGGLATIAAAQLEWRRVQSAERGDRERACIARLGLGLPSLGDWSFRFGHPGFGLGRAVGEVLRRERSREGELRERLRLIDSAVHARWVRCPVLCKLALADEVVPAPAAAAVFNALGTPAAQRWRFLTQYGHHEGGLGAMRREALFERCLVDFLDPRMSPRESMRRWAGVFDATRVVEPPAALREGGAGVEPASAPSVPAPGDRDEGVGLFGAADDERDADGLTPFDRDLIDAYRSAGRTLDDLPYTDEFDRVYDAIGGEASNRTRRWVFHRLHNLRKAGKLPRLGRSEESRPRIEPEEEALLAALVVELAGTLGQRDRLPYTPEMDTLLERFNARAGRSLEPHEVWRLVAKLAK